MKTQTLPTHDELIANKAQIAVNHINHREFVMNGTRYFCGWSSKRDPNYTQKTWDEPEYKVQGWCTYKATNES